MVKTECNSNKEGLISWEKGGPANMLCRHMLATGQLDGNETPLKVRELNEIFRKVSKRSFQAGWSRLKAEMGIHVRKNNPLKKATSLKSLMSADISSDEEEDDNISTTSIGKKPYAKNETGTDDKILAVSNDLLGIDVRSFVKWDPPFLIVPWEVEDAKKYLTVVVNMSTGVLADASNSKGYLEKGGRTLIVSHKWPKLLTDSEYLHKYWNNSLIETKKGVFTQKPPEFPPFHPKIIAFEKIYRQLKNTKEEDIWSHAKIELPFQVCENEIEIHCIGDKASGAYTMYINLKEYGVTNYNVGTAGPIIMLE